MRCAGAIWAAAAACAPLAAGAAPAPAAAAPAAPSTASARRGVLYGADDRQEARWAGEPWASLARERAVALAPADAVAVDADGRWRGPALGAREELCRDERFLDQPAVARCSGVLVDGETVLTAAHCAEACADLVVVRGFAVGEDGAPGPIQRRGCAAVTRPRPDLDVALVHLDAPVEGLGAIIVGTATIGATVAAIGHPQGLPAKVDARGEILAVTADGWGARLDLFEGSSGSGVFTRDGALLGVATAGGGDWVFDPARICLRARTSSGGDERVVSAATALAARADGDPGGCQTGGAGAGAVVAVAVAWVRRRGRPRAAVRARAVLAP